MQLHCLEQLHRIWNCNGRMRFVQVLFGTILEPGHHDTAPAFFSRSERFSFLRAAAFHPNLKNASALHLADSQNLTVWWSFQSKLEHDIALTTSHLLTFCDNLSKSLDNTWTTTFTEWLRITYLSGDRWKLLSNKKNLSSRFLFCGSIRGAFVVMRFLHRFAFVTAVVLMRFCIAAPIWPSRLYDSKSAE